jgi:hypothetical protein
MLEKAKHMCELIAQMDGAGFNFSNRTKAMFEDLYTAIRWEHRLPPQMCPDGGPDVCSCGSSVPCTTCGAGT